MDDALAGLKKTRIEPMEMWIQGAQTEF